VPVPTGTATPWREIEDPSLEEGSPVVTYFRPGASPGPSELLAEQLRADGLVRSTGPAMGVADKAEPELAWYGRDDDGQDQLCDEDGWTTDGRKLDDPLSCVVARVDPED